MNEFYGDVVRRSLAAAGEGTDKEGTVRRKARFKASIVELEKDPRVRDRIDGIAAAVGIVDQAEASWIDSLAIDAEHTDGKAPDRRPHWRLQGTWLAFGGILAGVSAAAAWAATALSSMLALVFVVGALLGLLPGGALYVRHLRAAIADDIGPQLRRLHADIDLRLRRIQSRLDNIESAVNLAPASEYAKLSQQSWPAAVYTRPIPDQSER
jgi:hypothetical protein